MKVKLTAAAALAAALAIAQTPAVVVSPVPQLQFFDNNGKPLSGGQVCTYAAGTTTPLTTYTSSTGTTANPNPVILDASGRANIWIAAPAIKYVLRAKGSPQNCSNGTTLYTVDGVQDQALKLRTDITGPNGLAMLTYTPPPTAAVPNPGGGPIPMNQRAAQIINVQDFDKPPFATCGVSSHDDSPASTAAVNYAMKNGGGTVTWPRGGQCWFNTVQGGVASVLYFGNNLTFDGNGSTANTTRTGLATIFGGLPSLVGWSDPSRVKSAFQEVLTGATQVTVCSGCGVNFHAGGVVFLQSGTVINGTPQNSEGNVVNSVAGDVLTMRYQTEHHFFYQNPPDGIVDVTADSYQNITFRHWRTAPQFPILMFGLTQCIHCQVLDVDGDFTGLGSVLSNNNNIRDFLEDNISITVTNPNLTGSPVIQFSTGTSDWTVRRTNLTCHAATPGGYTAVFWSEGASNAVFESGTISGNCNIGAATYQTGALKDTLISLDAGAQPEMLFSGGGTASSTNLRITGNTMIFPNTGNKTNIILTGDHLQFMGNRVLSSAATGSGAILVNGSCLGCMIEGNILTTGGYGFVMQGMTNHGFTLVNNNVTCTAATQSGFYIADDGQQTVGETVVGNTANGCATGLTVINPAHEIGTFAPNAFAGNMTPYSPASLSAPFANPLTGLTGIQNCASPLGAFSPALQGLVIGCGANNAVTLASPDGASLFFATPTANNIAQFGTDAAGNLYIIKDSNQVVRFPAGGGLMELLRPLVLNGSAFTLGGLSCATTGAGNPIVCN